ncbi:hypothetical protein ACHAXN_005014 [Cyclotella atomus]
MSLYSYSNTVLRWIEGQINDKSIFHSDINTAGAESFQTPDFGSLCGKIFRRIYRVYAIMYCNLFQALENMKMATHFNMCFKHLMYFSFEFGLLPEVEMEPIQVLIKPIMEQFRLDKATKYQIASRPYPCSQAASSSELWQRDDNNIRRNLSTS